MLSLECVSSHDGLTISIGVTVITSTNSNSESNTHCRTTFRTVYLLA